MFFTDGDNKSNYSRIARGINHSTAELTDITKPAARKHPLQTSENNHLIDQKKCITCCACIKNCPQNARTMKTGLVKDAAMRLTKLYKERKAPLFLFSDIESG
ncbi:4Fe-4S binding protein [Desulfosporosinus shakirovi]|uniref:4Fe-4S binding protein n=1 Tax=Desulfosporosinus shakirovi TaxID=2885154 RepID=UPI0037BEBD86|nr:4Fe-4S binding protein [Desulfosporosinus sp. SRJS8]